MKKIISSIIIMLIMTCSCANYDVNEVLLQKDDISLTWKGDVQISYSPSTCQLGYNESRNEYRVYDDKLANWFVLKCSEAPSEPGQIISSDVSWTGKSSIKTIKNLQFKVEKADENGKIWLWNQDNGIGIIIKSR